MTELSDEQFKAAEAFSTERIEQDVQDTMVEIRELTEKVKQYSKQKGPLYAFRVAFWNREIAAREEFVRLLNIILDKRKGVEPEQDIIHHLDKDEMMMAQALYGAENAIHLFI